ncbi:MAG: trypsin-like peptidase domain-containing protein, partial [Acidobacteriota bacterium]|nr:trypsin-like peptidase domain-containing protein [Acidobacteriota bacterium]
MVEILEAASNTQTHYAASSDFAAVIELLRRSSVQVGGGRDGLSRGGSGVIWHSSGNESIVVTNAHVVRGQSARVKMYDGKIFEAHVKSRDERLDLVALGVEARNLPAAIIGDAKDLRAGELVLAIGNPLGLVGALNIGIVHASGERWIEADVQLSPGNSGGMLTNSEGRVVGINSMIASGLALAVPSNVVNSFLARDERPRLGIVMRVVPVGRQGKPSLGFLILDVHQGSAAEKSGLLIGDTIIGTDMRSFH